MAKMFTFTAELSPQELGEPIDFDDETFAISSNQVDSVATGGADKKVHVQKVVEDEDDVLKFDEGSKELAMCFDSGVYRLEFCAGGKLLGISNDSHVQLMDSETKKVTSFP